MNRLILQCCAASALVSALVSSLVVGLAGPPRAGAQEERIRADEVIVAGADDAGLIRLRSGPGLAASVAVLDANGIHRANLNVGGPASLGGTLPDSSGLHVFAVDGARVGRLGTGGADEGGRVVNLRLADRQERDRIRLTVAEDGTPSIMMFDAAGNAIWSAP
jgi:hypothetical protein